MTIEQKAAAYDAAIKRVENIKTGKCETTFVFTEGLFEHIFPELKESEDEKVRKWIIENIQETLDVDGFFEGHKTMAKNAIAWLEKQGEQKPAENKGMNLVEEEMTPFQKKVFCIIDTTIEEEQGLKQVCDELLTLASNEIKQKPTTEIKSAEESLGIDSETYNKIVDECIYGEQKPAETEKGAKGNEREIPNSAWSEEDDVYLDDVLHIINTCSPKVHTIMESIKWLKSLKDRVQPQPKQEWKQENTGDLTDFENAMMHIGGSFFGDNAGLDPNDTNAIKEQANLLLGLYQKQDWSGDDYNEIETIACHLDNTDNEGMAEVLRNIRDKYYSQSNWKPSDEQMKALDDVISSKDIKYDVLSELYKDLKKLREE